MKATVCLLVLLARFAAAETIGRDLVYGGVSWLDRTVPLFVNGHLVSYLEAGRFQLYRPDTQLAYWYGGACPHGNATCSITTVAVTRGEGGLSFQCWREDVP
jgi:hypothetical protein